MVDDGLSIGSPGPFSEFLNERRALEHLVGWGDAKTERASICGYEILVFDSTRVHVTDVSMALRGGMSRTP